MIQYRRILFSQNVRYIFNRQCRQMCKIKKKYDQIGPADPVSNLHHVTYAVIENETPLERELRNHREELQTWNEKYWTKHNIKFMKEKLEFEEKELLKKGSTDLFLTAEQMSVFYKEFLDSNRKTNLKYLFEWYKKTFYVTFLHLKVNLCKLFKKR